MKKYTQLSLEERELVFEGLKRRMSQNEIAKLLRRDKSTISRELSRNSDSKGYYFYPQDAHAQSAKRKAQHGYRTYA
jgi:IS30 family transposase